VQTPTRRAKVW
jgi:hypothetical protein